MDYLIASVIGYGLGCIQASYLLGRLILRRDIREFGNGNAGASNATVVFGKRFGLMTMLIDAFKAIVAVIIIKILFRDSNTVEDLSNLVYVAGFFVIIGHNFPFYMSFKGGKGTAALIGLLYALDIRLGVIASVVMVLVIFVTDYMVLGTFSLLVMLLSYSIIFHFNWINLLLVLIISGMSVYKHFQNIIEIKNGTELKVRASLKAKREV